MQQLTKQRFDALMGSTRELLSLVAGTEHEWYSEANEKVLCVVVEDTSDHDYGCIVLGRDAVGRYRAVYVSEWYPTLDGARQALPILLADWASRDPQDFEQGDEPSTQMDFFTPVHPLERLNPSFAKLINDEAFSPARGIIESLMFYFKDPDGNFVEQFQSTAFNARIWELYLFAVLAESRCRIDRTHPAPDYLFTDMFGEAFIEAVTVNPNNAGEAGYPAEGAELDGYMRHYLPIKFSGPLTKKLERCYWDEPYINQRPICFAVADFHCPDSMHRSQDALVGYLYGQRFERTYDDSGRLRLTNAPVAEYVWGRKRVRSGFFGLPTSENVAAVLSTGEELILKFNRMGLRAGFGSGRVEMLVSGLRCLDHPCRVAPERFELDVSSRDYEEYWVDGLQVYHNPHALRPLDIRTLGDATHHVWRDGQLEGVYVDRSPFNLDTRIAVTTP